MPLDVDNSCLVYTPNTFVSTMSVLMYEGDPLEFNPITLTSLTFVFRVDDASATVTDMVNNN